MSMTVAELYKRDKGRCHICGNIVRMADATRDHLVPKALGGSNHRDNLALAHKYCNKVKADKVFRAEQHGVGWVVVDPKNEIVSDVYADQIDAKVIAEELNKDQVYLDTHYEGVRDRYEESEAYIIVSRNPVQNDGDKS